MNYLDYILICIEEVIIAAKIILGLGLLLLPPMIFGGILAFILLGLFEFTIYVGQKLIVLLIRKVQRTEVSET